MNAASWCFISVFGMGWEGMVLGSSLGGMRYIRSTSYRILGWNSFQLENGKCPIKGRGGLLSLDLISTHLHKIRTKLSKEGKNNIHDIHDFLMLTWKAISIFTAGTVSKICFSFPSIEFIHEKKRQETDGETGSHRVLKQSKSWICSLHAFFKNLEFYLSSVVREGTKLVLGEGPKENGTKLSGGQKGLTIRSKLQTCHPENKSFRNENSNNFWSICFWTLYEVKGFCPLFSF